MVKALVIRLDILGSIPNGVNKLILGDSNPGLGLSHCFRNLTESLAVSSQVNDLE